MQNNVIIYCIKVIYTSRLGIIMVNVDGCSFYGACLEGDSKDKIKK